MTKILMHVIDYQNRSKHKEVGINTFLAAGFDYKG